MREWTFVWPSWAHTPDIVYSESFGWNRVPNRFMIWYRTQVLFRWFWSFRASKKAMWVRFRAHFVDFVAVWFGHIETRYDA